jgi:hypothetical protein
MEPLPCALGLLRSIQPDGHVAALRAVAEAMFQATVDAKCSLGNEMMNMSLATSS